MHFEIYCIMKCFTRYFVMCHKAAVATEEVETYFLTFRITYAAAKAALRQKRWRIPERWDHSSLQF